MFGKFCLYLSLVLTPTLAYQTFQEKIPNSKAIPHPCKPNYRWPGVGHLNPNGGGDRNVFGEDFAKMGYWWNPELCAKDSDGDSQTNGEELGDPDCTWKSGEIPTRTTDITHPGVCDPYDSEFCREKNEFLSCELDQFEACETIKQPEVMTLDARFPNTEVPAKETTYYCMTFDIPKDQDYHLIAHEALIDNANVLHHMLIYGCKDADEAYIPIPSSCDMASEGKCSEIISVWTVGQAGTCYGKDVGFLIGQNGYQRIRLEIHYNNPTERPEFRDSSGLRLFYQPRKPEVQSLITFITGQGALEIPPGESRVEQEGFCPGSCLQYLITQPVYITSVLNHMHYLGHSMKVEVFRNGKEIIHLSDDENYDYDSPVIHVHDPPFELLPGDEIKTECVYNSLYSDRWVYTGDATSDEMCYAFLTMYPAEAVPFPACISQRSLSPCEYYMGAPVGGCDWRSFSNVSHPDTMERMEVLRKDCNLDGRCRPECKRTIERIADHPCLQGEAAYFAKTGLTETHEGTEFLGRLHSCQMDGHMPEPKGCKEECSNYCWPDDNVYSGANVMGTFPAIFVLLAPVFVMIF